MVMPTYWKEKEILVVLLASSHVIIERENQKLHWVEGLRHTYKHLYSEKRRSMEVLPSFVIHHLLPTSPYVFNIAWVLICQCFGIWSCMLNGTIANPSLHCCHSHLLFLVLIIFLLSLLHGFSPLSRTEHISKYSFIEKVMKLPFQRVVIHRKQSSNKGVMSIALRAVQNWFQDVLHLVIQP